jgi:hypothetical protein
MYVLVCDITTCTSSIYEHKWHTYNSRKDTEFNKFKNKIMGLMLKAPVALLY